MLFRSKYRAYVAGDYATAIENYQKAVEADPDQEYALYFLGHAYYNSGDTANANKTFKEYMEKFPGSERASEVQTYISDAATGAAGGTTGGTAGQGIMPNGDTGVTAGQDGNGTNAGTDTGAPAGDGAAGTDGSGMGTGTGDGTGGEYQGNGSDADGTGDGMDYTAG